jgi:hypothetical protein
MADTSSRGGKKQVNATQPKGSMKKQGVRPGSTAARKERGQKGPRR